MSKCTIPDCERRVHARAFCSGHYSNWYRHGIPVLTVPTAPERFWAKVEKTGSCWLWRGCVNPNGYGVFGVKHGQPNQLAHRYAYELQIGPIPARMTLDHLCRKRACVRPDHLEAVSVRENILRGDGPSARQARQTHCLRGHLLPPTDKHGRRRCGECEWMYKRQQRQEAWR